MRPTLYVEPELCQNCSSCSARRACRPRAILQMERGGLPAVDASRCLGCKACMASCPHGALVVMEERHGKSASSSQA